MSKTNPSEHLERIRQARDSEESSTETAETFTCPIDGCNRTVIGSPGHLRNHVSQSSDIGHRHRTLNDSLEIEFDEEAYHAEWGPGISEDDDERRESIYDGYEGVWGPGAPKVNSESTVYKFH